MRISKAVFTNKELRTAGSQPKLERVPQIAIFVEKLFLKEWLQTNYFLLRKGEKYSYKNLGMKWRHIIK